MLIAEQVTIVSGQLLALMDVLIPGAAHLPSFTFPNNTGTSVVRVIDPFNVLVGQIPDPDAMRSVFGPSVDDNDVLPSVMQRDSASPVRFWILEDPPKAVMIIEMLRRTGLVPLLESFEPTVAFSEARLDERPSDIVAQSRIVLSSQRRAVRIDSSAPHLKRGQTQLVTYRLAEPLAPTAWQFSIEWRSLQNGSSATLSQPVEVSSAPVPERRRRWFGCGR
ncbi:MAG: hypothetical protein JOZ58_03100 [Acetobacteraceae bacterium]|nr:hypothetical protein [Acetobacteraceae bacterium]